MAVNYNDRRFQEVNEEKQNALNNVNNMYNDMINNSDKYYNDQIKATEDYGNKQAEMQQANTDFAIEKIEQQKDWTKKDYTKEQKGAYADWQRQSNQYGANAESLASQGLTNTGYSESSQVSMYNTYQNRVATARESFTRAITEYDNSIKEAQLANNSALAEIAYQTLQTKLSLSLQGFQYKNGLLQQQLQAQNETEDRYYTRWKGVLDQINTENALAEQQRQFNANLGLQYAQLNYQKEKDALQQSQIEKKEDTASNNPKIKVVRSGSQTALAIWNDDKQSWHTLNGTKKEIREMAKKFYDLDVSAYI